MSESPPPFLLPRHAVAAVDGSFAPQGSSAGIVMIHEGRILLRGLPLPDVDGGWQAEAYAAGLSIKMAKDLGVTRLRLLIDHHSVACIVQGRPADRSDPDQSRLADWVLHARRAGMEVTARAVQGHTETVDLPSRMNELAHILCDLGRSEPVHVDHPHSGSWLETLVEMDGRFAFPDGGNHPRWHSFMNRHKAAHFLGVGLDTVDDLVQAGHLMVTMRGIPRRSIAEVYAVLQDMRHDAYFGFDDARRPLGSYEDEVARGWDARIAPRKKPKVKAPPTHMPDPADLLLPA